MTPSYIFDLDLFRKRIRDISEALPGIPLVYSIKANPFLLPYLPEDISRKSQALQAHKGSVTEA